MNLPKKIRSFPVIIEHDEDGWYAECPKLASCYAQGESYEDVIENIREVILLCLEDEKENIGRLSEISLSMIDVSVAA